MDTITTIQSLLTCNGSARPATVALTPSETSLIAAAPCLLAALKAARPFVAQVESREMSNPALDALSLIDAAIQRAEA